MSSCDTSCDRRSTRTDRDRPTNGQRLSTDGTEGIEQDDSQLGAAMKTGAKYPPIAGAAGRGRAGS
jgi:hypothetical protein